MTTRMSASSPGRGGEGVVEAGWHDDQVAPPGGDDLVAGEQLPVAEWALVWHTAAETDLIRDFAEVVADLGPLRL